MSSLLSRLEGNSRSKLWIKAHLDYPHKDWCLIWPFGRNQAGYANFGPPSTAVHRVMCEHRNGPPPTPKHQAAHSCGRGHDGCVNEWHLSWKTNSENQLERYRQAGLMPRWRLTPEQVKEIIALKGLAPVDDLATKYGVTAGNIHRIHSGELWRKIGTPGSHFFTEAEVRLIRSTSWQDKSAAQFAEEFGATRSAIDRIRQRRSYNWVSDEETVVPHSNSAAD